MFTKLKIPKQTVVYKTEEIHKCFEFYYDKLYSQVHNDNKSEIENFLNSLDLPQVTQEQNNSLVSEISSEEINAAENSKVTRAQGLMDIYQNGIKFLEIP